MSEPLYNTQLAIFVNGQLIPIHSLDYDINSMKRRIHHLHKNNNGAFKQPKEFDFTMRLYQIGKNKEALAIMLLQLTDAEFMVVLTEYDGNDWTFYSIGFNKCYITRNSTSIRAETPPESTIRCICLEFNPNNIRAYGAT